MATRRAAPGLTNRGPSMAPRVCVNVGGPAPHHGAERIASTIDDDAAAHRAPGGDQVSDHSPSTHTALNPNATGPLRNTLPAPSH